MTKKTRRKTVIFPDGDSGADFMWVQRVAERDLELFWDGNEEALIDSLRSISAKEDRSRLEDIYLRTVLNSDRQSADWPQPGR